MGLKICTRAKGFESVGGSLGSKCKREFTHESKVLGMGVGVCMGVKVSQNCRWESM
jgi:hypothetical protein